MELKLTHNAKLDAIEAKQNMLASEVRANQDRTLDILARVSAGQENNNRALQELVERLEKKKVEDIVPTL